MKSREELQAKLEEILGSRNVYHQAPPNTGMKYPCIVYSFSRPEVEKADNVPYIITGRWEVHHMYKNPNHTLLPSILFASPYVTHDRRIVHDGVYNDYYTIYQ